MLSNSKLSAAQKLERKIMLANLPRDATLVNNGEITILAVPDGKVTRVFSSVKSDDEMKFRRKVGEFHAMARFFFDANGGLILPGFWVAVQVLDSIETQTDW